MGGLEEEETPLTNRRTYVVSPMAREGDDLPTSPEDSSSASEHIPVNVMVKKLPTFEDAVFCTTAPSLSRGPGKEQSSSSDPYAKTPPARRPQASAESRPPADPRKQPAHHCSACITPKNLAVADCPALAASIASSSSRDRGFPRPFLSRSGTRTARYKSQNPLKDSAPHPDDPSDNIKSTSKGSFAPQEASEDAVRPTHIATDSELESVEQKHTERMAGKEGFISTNSSDASGFEIEYPLLRVPTSENIESSSGRQREADTTAGFRSPDVTKSKHYGELQPQERACTGGSNGNSLNDFTRRLPKERAGTPRGNSKVNSSTPTATVRAVSRWQTLAPQDAGRFVEPKHEHVLPLLSAGDLTGAASDTRGRAAYTSTLDDLAHSYKGRSWSSRRSPIASQGNSSHSRIFRSLPSAVDADRVSVPRAVAAEAVRSVGYCTSHQYAYREEYILYPLAALILITFVTTVLLILWPESHNAGHKRGVKQPSTATCISPSCSRDAVYLNDLLSWDHISPCEDFYAFVCRQYTARYAAPHAGSSSSTDDDLAAFLEDRLYASLQNDVLKEASNLSAIMDLHSKCMNAKRIEDEEWNPLLELMADVFLEGFPFTPPIRGSLSVWQTAAKILRKTGTAALLGVGICANPATVHTDLLFIGLPEMLKINDHADINSANFLYMNTVFAAMKGLKKEHVPSTFSLNVLQFARDLTKIVGTAPTKNISRVEFLQASSQLVNFLEEIFRDVRSYYYLGIGTEIMIHPAPLIDEVLKLTEETEAHTVMNYLGVRLMVQVSPFVPNAGLDDFYSVLLYGKHRGVLPRWQLCVRATEKALFPLIYAALLDDLKKHVSTKKLDDLAHNIITEFQSGVEASPHFSKSSKAVIRSILNATFLRVTGPNWVSDSFLIDAYASGLPIKAAINKSALDTYIIYHEYNFLQCMERGSRERWSRSVFTPRCWYEPYPDTIYVPLLLFNISRAFQGDVDVIQLSRAGPRLMRCAFDMLLSKAHVSYDRNNQWLTEETESKLRSVEACLDSSAASTDFRLKRTRDVLAANFSYSLFLKSAKKSEKPLSLTLPNNHFLTQEQLFFVYLALQSCEQRGGLDNLPSSSAYDCNTALRNTEYFTLEYSCDVGTPMNAQRC